MRPIPAYGGTSLLSWIDRRGDGVGALAKRLLPQRPEQFNDMKWRSDFAEAVAERARISAAVGNDIMQEMEVVEARIVEAVSEFRGRELVTLPLLTQVNYAFSRRVVSFGSPSITSAEIVGSYLASASSAGTRIAPRESAMSLELDVVELGHLQFLLNMFAKRPIDTEVKPHLALEHLGIRNLSYPRHALKTTEAVLGNHEERLRQELGFNATEYCNFVREILVLLTKRVRSRSATSGTQMSSLAEAVWLKRSDVARIAKSEAILDQLRVAVGSGNGSYQGPFGRSMFEETPLLFDQDLDQFAIPSITALVQNSTALLAGAAGITDIGPAFEEHVHCLLAQSLDADNGERGIHYRLESDALFEADSVFVQEGVVLSCEQKSAAMSFPARRGDTARFNAFMAEGPDEGVKQVRRMSAYLEGGNTTILDRHGKVTESRLPDCSNMTALRLVVTGEQSSVALHGAASLDGPDIGEQPISVIGIGDLSAICELTESSAELLHYLYWRSGVRHERRVSLNDELDLFANYRYGMVGNEGDDSSLTVAHSSTADFDSLFEASVFGSVDVADLHRSQGEVLNRFRARLKSERPPGWTAQTFALLHLSDEVALAVDELIRHTPRSDSTTASSVGRVQVVFLRAGASYLDALLEVGSLASVGTELRVWVRHEPRVVLSVQLLR